MPQGLGPGALGDASEPGAGVPAPRCSGAHGGGAGPGRPPGRWAGPSEHAHSTAARCGLEQDSPVRPDTGGRFVLGLCWVHHSGLSPL